MKKIILLASWMTISCMAEDHTHSILFDIELKDSHIYEVVNLLRERGLRVSFEEKVWIKTGEDAQEYMLKLDPQNEKIGPNQFRADFSIDKEPEYKTRNFDEDRDYLLAPPINLSYKQVDVGTFLDEVVKQDSNYSWYYMFDCNMYVIHPSTESLRNLACRRPEPDELWATPHKILPENISGHGFWPPRFTRYDYPEGSFESVHKYLCAFCSLAQKRDPSRRYMWSIRGFRVISQRKRQQILISYEQSCHDELNDPLKEYHQIKKRIEHYENLHDRLTKKLGKASSEKGKEALKKQIKSLNPVLKDLKRKADIRRKMIYGAQPHKLSDTEITKRRLKWLRRLREKILKKRDKETDPEKLNSMAKRIKRLDNAILNTEKTIKENENKGGCP